jgi:hypothetical protein
MPRLQLRPEFVTPDLDANANWRVLQQAAAADGYALSSLDAQRIWLLAICPLSCVGWETTDLLNIVLRYTEVADGIPG